MNAPRLTPAQAAAEDLLDALRDLVARDETEAAQCGFERDEMTWLEDARRAIAKANYIGAAYGDDNLDHRWAEAAPSGCRASARSFSNPLIRRNVISAA